MNVLSRLVTRVPAVSMFAILLLAISSVAQAQPVENVQIGYAGADAGDWGGKGGAPVGPADGICANMGAVGKVNLLSGFGFNLPGDAIITGVEAYIKAGSSGGQDVGLQLATQAAVEPATHIGSQVNFPTTDVGSGNCSTTVVTSNGPALADWGLSSGQLTPALVNNSAFGIEFTKLITSEVKVDAVCLAIAYTTTTGPAVTEDCFEVVTPEANQITVVKEVVGSAPGSDWDFDPSWDDPFTLPAGGGFQVFGDLTDGLYTITETTKEGYNVSVQCFEGETVVASGTDSVEVDLDNADQRDNFSVTCVFTNTEILPPPPLTRTTFTVQKNFSDGNTDQDVTINIQCFTGLPLNQSQTVNPDNAGQFEVEFVVESFDQGTLDCNVFEDEVDGYTGSYVADSTVSPDFGSTDAKCYYNDIDTTRAGLEQNLCTITNDPNPVEVYVTKDWVIDGSGGDQLDPAYSIDLFCYDGEILGGYDGGYYSYTTFSNSYGTADHTYTAAVIPNWDGGTYCYAVEDVYDNSIEVDGGDCAYDVGGFTVEIGDADGADGCTITNTVFYEGIPTLSQYGMVILALLMLGVGFVGFRRFV